VHPLRAFKAWLQRKALEWATTRTTVHDIPTVVVNTRYGVSTETVLERLDAALTLLRNHVPHHYRRLHRDVAEIISQRYYTRGAFLPQQWACLVELSFVGNETVPVAQVAATILHEAMHARLHAAGLRGTITTAREERFCRTAEVEFGRQLPDGAAVVARATAAAEGSDAEVAFPIDERLGHWRAARSELEALPLPGWAFRILAKRRGLDVEPPNEPRAR